MHTHSHISYTHKLKLVHTISHIHTQPHIFKPCTHIHKHTFSIYTYTYYTHAYPFTDFLHTHTHTFPIHVTHAYTCTHFLHTNTCAHAHIGFVGIKTWFHAIYTSLHLILFLSQHMVHIQTIFGEDEWSWASFHIHTYRYASFLLAAA